MNIPIDSTYNRVSTSISKSNNIDEPFRAQSIYDKFKKKLKNYKQKIKDKIRKNKKYEITAFILSLLANLLYLVGLQGCYGDEVYCLARLGLSFYIKILVLNIISCFCVCTVLVLMTFRIVSMFHLLYLVLPLIFLMLSDQGTNLAHHGYFNSVGYIFLLIIFYPITTFIYFMVKVIKKKKYHIYIPIFVILFSLYILCVILIKKNTKCVNWEMGLNNTKIYNNEHEYACQIGFPKKCYLNIFDSKLNMSNIIKKDCTKRDDTEKRMLFEYIKKSKNPYATPKAKRIGYPQINKGDFPLETHDGMVKLSREVVLNLVDMDNLPPHITPDKIPDTYVDFTNDPDDPDSKFGKIHFNLTKNETLIEERNKKSEKSEVIFNNIIVLFIDTVSRAHVNRKMPKFKEWLEKFMKYESEDFINYQFLKFHSLGVHTLLNLKPMTYGESVLSPNGVNILKYLKEKGYITAQANNYCMPEPYQMRPSFDNSNITNEYFDYELISLFCEPNYFRPENPFPLNRGNCALLRRCLYGHDTFDYLFNYSKLFWKTYEGSRRFLRLSSMDSHEATGELIKLVDEPLTNFLDDLYKSGDLNDTILFLFSDHGNHMAIHLSLFPTDDLPIEKIMPFFFILVPKKTNEYDNKYFLDEFYDTLYKNQQSLTNCYDIHDTILHILLNNFEKGKRPFSVNGTSLFKRVDDMHRTCDNFPEIYAKQSPGTLTCNCINNEYY